MVRVYITELTFSMCSSRSWLPNPPHNFVFWDNTMLERDNVMYCIILICSRTYLHFDIFRTIKIVLINNIFNYLM